jgi:hypothetical protein
MHQKVTSVNARKAFTNCGRVMIVVTLPSTVMPIVENAPHNQLGQPKEAVIA